MKCTIVFGSPRKQGNTFSLLLPFMKELESLGVEVDFFDAFDLDVSECQVCLECQKVIDHAECAVKDDMIPILASMTSADLIVYASPVYLWAAPAPVKAVMDRTVYASCKYYGMDPHGPALFAKKKVALITTCGYPVEKGADLYAEMLKRYCKHCRMTWAGILAERHKNLKKPFMDVEKESHAKAFANELYRLLIEGNQ